MDIFGVTRLGRISPTHAGVRQALLIVLAALLLHLLLAAFLVGVVKLVLRFVPLDDGPGDEWSDTDF